MSFLDQGLYLQLADIPRLSANLNRGRNPLFSMKIQTGQRCFWKENEMCRRKGKCHSSRFQPFHSDSAKHPMTAQMRVASWREASSIVFCPNRDRHGIDVTGILCNRILRKDRRESVYMRLVHILNR